MPLFTDILCKENICPGRETKNMRIVPWPYMPFNFFYVCETWENLYYVSINNKVKLRPIFMLLSRVVYIISSRLLAKFGLNKHKFLHNNILRLLSMTFFMALRTVRTYDALLYSSKFAFYCLILNTRNSEGYMRRILRYELIKTKFRKIELVF